MALGANAMKGPTTVEPKYTRLQNQTIAVMAWTDPSIGFDFPNLQFDITSQVQRKLQQAGVESLHRQQARIGGQQPPLRADLPTHPEIDAPLEPRPDLLPRRGHAPASLVGERMAVHRVWRGVLHGRAAQPRFQHQLHRLVHRPHAVIAGRNHVAVDVNEATHHPQSRRYADGAVPVKKAV